MAALRGPGGVACPARALSAAARLTALRAEGPAALPGRAAERPLECGCLSLHLLLRAGEQRGSVKRVAVIAVSLPSVGALRGGGRNARLALVLRGKSVFLGLWHLGV